MKKIKCMVNYKASLKNMVNLLAYKSGMLSSMLDTMVYVNATVQKKNGAIKVLYLISLVNVLYSEMKILILIEKATL